LIIKIKEKKRFVKKDEQDFDLKIVDFEGYVGFEGFGDFDLNLTTIASICGPFFWRIGISLS